jgi:hypothetical protein
MPQDDDLQLVEFLGASTQKYELEQAAQSQVAKRPEQEERLLGIGGAGATDSTRAYV